jgi:hypothetical protein
LELLDATVQLELPVQRALKDPRVSKAFKVCRDRQVQWVREVFKDSPVH